MTEPREVTVSDEEIKAFWSGLGYPNRKDGRFCFDEELRQALAAFLARRVPNRKPPVEPGTKMSKTFQAQHDGHNGCRDKVLKGV